MKSKFFLVALVAIIMVTGMVMVSCSKCPGNGKCTYDAVTYQTNPFAVLGDMSSWCFYSSNVSLDEMDAQAESCFGNTGTATAKISCGC